MAEMNVLVLVDQTLQECGCPYDRDALVLDARPPAPREVLVDNHRIGWKPMPHATDKQILEAEKTLSKLDLKPKKIKSEVQIAEDIQKWINSGVSLDRTILLLSKWLAFHAAQYPDILPHLGLPLKGVE